LKDHDEIVKKYKETVDSFNKKLGELSDQRNKIDEQRVETSKNYLEALNKRDILNLEKS
jgi:septal ring factor EnvC (AmiA/AmiB activator)